MKTVHALLTATVIATLGFTACSGDTKSGTNEQMEEQAAIYYCPMECEGDKTYEEAGQCPVCGMDLVVKE